MEAVLTTWMLSNPGGAPSRCVVQQQDHGYDVIVWAGPSIVLWERIRDAGAALDRADEFWTVLVAHGRQPITAAGAPLPPIARRCRECGGAAGRLTHLRNRFAVWSCAVCGVRWNDRIRVNASDRRLQPRPDLDRRRAA